MSSFTKIPTKAYIPRSLTLPEAECDDLEELLLHARRKGTFHFKEIENMRINESKVKKLFRLRRADGEEFAVQRVGKELRIWSSVPPADDTPMSKPAEEYIPGRPRHSNLNVMPKLTGPKNGALGVRAWKLCFDTPLAAFNFITCQEAALS